MPPALPPSLWADSAPPGPGCPPLHGARACDVAVVGAGYTGLSAALHLAESGVDVRVLESGEPGWGASGRNGGQVNPGFKALPAAIVQRHGREAGERISRLAGDAPSLVFDLVDRLRIDCQPVRAGYIQGAGAPSGLARARAWVEQWRALGAPVRMLGRDEIAALTGTTCYAGGMLDERGGNLQPLTYARGLARAALAAGAQVHGDSTARALRRVAGRWHLATAHGELAASHLILAGNGYTDGLWPGLAREVVPVKSVIVASASLSDDVRRSILPGGQHVSENRRVGTYFRMDPGGRFLLGGRGDAFGAPEAADGEHLKALSWRMFPQLRGCAWTHCWGGFVAMTPESMPRLVDLGDGAFCGLGYNGRGVAMATAMGRELARAARGESPALPCAPASPILAHGLRRLAVAARVALGRALDGIESRHRT